jgi:predicted aldo/keto reductase-like oxidoreductase
MDRRKFLKNTAAGLAAVTGLSIDSTREVLAAERKSAGRLAQRRLGGTGRRLSVIGFGGILVMGHQQSEADRMVAEAVERGVNYFDVAPSYGNGEAEEKLGPALQPYRSRVFLADKTAMRTRDGAEKELQQSLKRMRTDYFDLYQLHALTTMDELNQSLASNGAIQAILAARKDGRIRHIGFSAHSAEVALAAMDRFDFDTILFPVNYVLYHQANFGPQVVKKAREKGMGILALKTMARQPWPAGAKRNHSKCWYEPITEAQEASLAVRFTLSEPVTSAVPPGHADLFWMAVRAAEGFRPLSRDDRKVLKERAASLGTIFRLA